MCLDLAANNLHRAINQAILLGESLINNSQTSGQPTVRELGFELTTLVILVNLGLDHASSLGSLVGVSDIVLLDVALQSLGIGHYDRTREGTLVVVDDNLVDVGRFIDNRLLHTFGAILLAIACNQQALESTQHVEEIIVSHITHIARIEPAIAYGIGRCCRILPVASHYVLATDNDLALGAIGLLTTLIVQNADIERLNELTRRTETVLLFHRDVSRDYGSSLRQTVALHHRDTNSVEETLQLRVEQCATANKEFQLATERLTHLREENLIEQSHHGTQNKTPAATLMIAVLIVFVSGAQSKVEQFLGRCSLSADRALDALAEILSQRRYRQQEVRLHLADICGDVAQCLHRRTTNLRRSYRCATSDHNVETYDVSKAVVQRQNDQRTIRRRDLNTCERLFDICRIVAMSQNYTLRVGRCARCVGDSCIVVVLDCATDFEELLAVLREILLALGFQCREGDLALLQIVDFVEYDHLL